MPGKTCAPDSQRRRSRGSNRSPRSLSACILMSALLLLAGPVLLSGRWTALGFGYPDAIRSGTILGGFSVRSIACAGAMAAATGSSDPGALFANPAGLVIAPATRLALGGGVSLWKETVELNTYRQDQNGLVIGTAMAAFKTEPGPGYAFGAGIARVSDASHEDARYNYGSPPDTTTLESIERFHSSGGFWEVLGGGAVSLAPWLDVGISAGQRFGTITREYEFDDLIGNSDSTWTTEIEEEEFCWHAGILVPFGFNSVGLSYSSESENYPSRLALGGMINAGSTNRGAIGLEGELRDPGGDNQIVARAFGQYSPEHNLLFMGGVSFSEASDPNLTTLSISGGGVYSLRHFHFEAALEWRNSTSADSSFTHPVPDEIKGSVTSVVFGIAYVL